METANASQGRLRGATSIDQVLGGEDVCYEISQRLGMLYVPWTEGKAHPIEERCGRHLQGVYEYSQAYNAANPNRPVTYTGVPSYNELYTSAAYEDLGGAQLAKFLK